MKRKVVAAVALALVVSLAFLAGIGYSAATIRLIVEGKDIAADVPPFIQSGRTFVPIRFVAEALGYPVSWDSKTRTVNVGIPPGGVDLEAYSGQKLSLSSPATIFGIKYSKGYDLDRECAFNLAGRYSTITFSAGIPDGRGYDEDAFIAYGDGAEIAIGELKRTNGLEDYTVDVKGVNQLQIKLRTHSVVIINIRGQK